MHYKLSVFLVLILLFGACKNEALIRRGDSVDVAYSKAKAFYDEGDFVEAANAFETVTRIARGTDYGRDSQYYLAESYYKSRQYLLAAAEYDRFISFYPTDDRREAAEYKAAMSYFHKSPRYRLDQSETHTAIERFRLFISRYPNSEFVTEAAQKINQLRAKLAHKIYGAAEFYIRTEQFEAATIYLNLTIDRYPETEWAEKALVQLVKTFVEYADNSIASRQAERYRKAVEAYEKFLQLFPQSEMRGEIEQYHDDAQQNLNNIKASEKTSEKDS